MTASSTAVQPKIALLTELLATLQAAHPQQISAVRQCGCIAGIDLALALGEDIIVINSFSKYFNMTGWRLGWLVVPPAMLPAVEKLAQNMFICASSVAQHAALACFSPESTAIFESRKEEFRRRRDFLLPELRRLGFGIPVLPDGAFYIYADCSAFTHDSDAFAREVLDATGVVLVPGLDFGEHSARHYLRVSYATSMENLAEAVGRLGAYLAARKTSR